MRPIQISPMFNVAIDVLSCVFGGITSPKLCGPQLTSAFEPYQFLVTFNAPSPETEETHLSKENYFKIVSSDERTKQVVNSACAMTAVMAWERLKEEGILFGEDGKLLAEFENEPSLGVLECLRNSAAHGNHFVFKFRWKKFFVDENKELKWRGLVLDKTWNTKAAFPDFFPAGYFAYLFEDISKLL